MEPAINAVPNALPASKLYQPVFYALLTSSTSTPPSPVNLPALSSFFPLISATAVTINAPKPVLLVRIPTLRLVTVSSVQQNALSVEIQAIALNAQQAIPSIWISATHLAQQ